MEQYAPLLDDAAKYAKGDLALAMVSAMFAVLAICRGFAKSMTGF